MSVRRLMSIGVMIACALVVPAYARVLPQRGALDGRIRTAFYDPAQVYELHAYVGYQIELEFEAGETFAGQGGGDLDGIAFGAFQNHVILKPRAENVGTNLVIYTNRRAYRFDYIVHAHAPDPVLDEVMYTVRFVYPAPPAPAPAHRVDEQLASAVRARMRNLDYWFCGNAAVQPVSAFDDGVQTHFQFGRRAELPALFVLNDDDSESLLNFTVEDGEIVVHRVARRFVVRRGRLVGCIVNKAFDGGGERLESGTLAPDVLRERAP